MVSAKSKSAPAKNSAEGKLFGIVASRYHEELTKQLVENAVEALSSFGAKKDDVTTVWVPGAFEIPLAARAMLQQHSFDAVICLGIVVKGETMHDQYIAREVARGIAQLNQATGTPVIFGVLTVQSLEQAKARCGGDKGDKGTEAAETAVHMLQVLELIKNIPTKQQKGVGF
jgi:6,7-dimethyl-8-ribityllumazine synthase